MPRKISGIDSPTKTLSSLGREPEGSPNERLEVQSNYEGLGEHVEGFPIPEGVVIHGSTDTSGGSTGGGVSLEPSENKVTENNSAEKSSSEAIEDVDSLARSPREFWEEDLSALGLTVTEAEHILDQVMTTGQYYETYKVGGSVLKLRTRTTFDADRLMEILQDQKPETTGVYSHLVTRVNLASSLVQYGKRTFKHSAPTEDNRERVDYEWRDRYRFCAALPSPAFYTISQILQKFDEKVSLACDARSVENF